VYTAQGHFTAGLGQGVLQRHQDLLDLGDPGEIDRPRLVLAQSDLEGLLGVGHARGLEARALLGAQEDHQSVLHLLTGCEDRELALVLNGIVENFRELKESGITMNLTNYPDATSMAKALDVARKAGISMIVSCPELKTDPASTVKRFRSHPATAGYMLRDEPGRNDFPELGDWARAIHAEDDRHFCYLNLFPNYAAEKQLGTPTYREHVDLFIKEVPVPVISFAH